MPYEPLRSELSAEEQHFLDVVAPIGIDWIDTRQQLATRFGVSRYCDWADVVALPPSNALSDPPLAWHVYADPLVMDLPPEYLFASFMPHDEARKNHRDIEAQLTARLGEPAIADTSNCLVREWRFGLFAINLHTFPPELQDEALRGRNALHKYDPRLAIASSISITSDYAHVYPDGSLSRIAEVVRAAGSGGNVGSASGWSRPSRRYSRRNPQSLTRALPPSQPVAWVDPSGLIGLSVPSESLVFQRTADCHLVLVHIRPARGRGGSSLELLGPDMPGASLGRGRDERVTLFEGPNMDSLDVAADHLAALWGPAITHELTVDD